MSVEMIRKRTRVVIQAALSACTAVALVAAAAPAQADSAAPRLTPEGLEIPTVGTSSLSGPVDREPVGDVDPARYLPTPSPDPWYSDPPHVDESIPAGTVLASRDTDIPWYNGFGVDRAYQMLVRTTDSHDQPTSTVSTVLLPDAPWHGEGPRPILSFAVAIDGLGMECQPSWAFVNDFSIEFPPITQILLARGYGLVLTDHHGPKGAYGAARLGGHALLDGIRAARAFEPAGLGDSPAAVFGYSGGGISAGAAAQMQPVYAPEMGEYLEGIAVGGVPIDFSDSFDTLDGTIGSGLFRGAVVGIAREYPELYTLLNRTGDRVVHELRDKCAWFNTAAGLDRTPLQDLTVSDDLRNEPLVKAVFAETRLGPNPNRPGEIPEVPTALFWPDASFGIGDQFFPEAGAKELREQWCAAGADVDYIPIAGGHVLGMFTAPGPVLEWIDRRLAGVDDGDGCANVPVGGSLG